MADIRSLSVKLYFVMWSIGKHYMPYRTTFIDAYNVFDIVIDVLCISWICYRVCSYNISKVCQYILKSMMKEIVAFFYSFNFAVPSSL